MPNKTELTVPEKPSFAQLLTLLTAINGNIALEKGKAIAHTDERIGELGKQPLAEGESEAKDHTVKTYVDAVTGNVSSLQTLVSTLIGSDSGKSARAIANEEMAAVLLVDPETGEKNFQTLQALAKYLEDHPEEVAAILANIKNIEDLIGNMPTKQVADENGKNPGEEGYVETLGPVYSTIVAYIQAVAAAAAEAAKAVQGDTENTVKDLEDAFLADHSLTEEQMNTLLALFPTE